MNIHHTSPVVLPGNTRLTFQTGLRELGENALGKAFGVFKAQLRLLDCISPSLITPYNRLLSLFSLPTTISCLSLPSLLGSRIFPQLTLPGKAQKGGDFLMEREDLLMPEMKSFRLHTLPHSLPF